MRIGLAAALLAGMWAVCAASVEAAEDLVIADFEAKDYGAWKVEGKSFGRGPARGAFPGQLKVEGFQGKGLVNSYRGGDASTGKISSPEFTIERDYISFLIGGGGYAETTCMNLLLEGEVVRSATGRNTKPGGTEQLRWESWHVNDLQGKKAHIEIIDARSEGWGHINVDQIVQSDEPYVSEKKRDFVASQKYLNLPVTNQVEKKWVRLYRGEKIVREFDIELAHREAEIDFWVVLDLSEFKGESLRLWADQVPRDCQGFELIRQEERIIGAENLYQEAYRPQFHFSPQRGWMNDPNGMVYYKGEYHLFFQHNPYGWKWGNMTWGHAVSKDMVHWEELGDAIHPDEYGTIFSGSAVVDWHNTTSFQTGAEPPLVCIFTYAGERNLSSAGAPHTQALAYSNDRGRTWTKYEGNPVQGHIAGGNRDPKVIWREESQDWVIVLYIDENVMMFFRSKDLKHWEKQSELKSFYECPELFALPLDGEAGKEKWIHYGGSGDYMIGDFDGKRFTPDGKAIRYHYGNCFYASQTFNDIPAEDGRRIQIAWGRIGHPEMPFNQMMDFPVELTLHSTEEGPRLFAWPVKEIESLYKETPVAKTVALDDSREKLAQGDLFDITATIDLGSAKEVGFSIRGLDLVYNAEKGVLRCLDKEAPLKAVEGKIAIRLLVDRLSVEIFANRGRVYMPMGYQFEEAKQAIEVFAKGGTAAVADLKVIPLQSAW